MRYLVAILAIAVFFGQAAIRVVAQQRYWVEPHYFVSIFACTDKKHCAHFKTPVDADNEVECYMTIGMERVMQWRMDHPEWKIKEWHCAKPDEAYL